MVIGPDFYDESSRFSLWQVHVFMMVGPYFQWEVEILIMTSRDSHYDRSKFSYDRSIFLMRSRDFHYDRSRISRWKVEIFIMAGPYFQDDRWRFLRLQFQIFKDDRYRFSRSQIQIFVMTVPDFHDNRSRFLWWQVEIFKVTGAEFQEGRCRFSWRQVQIFMLTCPDLHECRSRFSKWQVQILIVHDRNFMMRGRDFHNDRFRNIFFLVGAYVRSSSSTNIDYLGTTEF